jgi:hypothetical protein
LFIIIIFGQNLCIEDYSCLYSEFDEMIYFVLKVKLRLSKISFITTKLWNKVCEIIFHTHLYFQKRIDSLTVYPYLTIRLALVALTMSVITLIPSELASASHPSGTQTDETLTGGVGHLIRCLGNGLTPTICEGTNHNDKIIGINGPETIYGFDGRDYIQGFSDADVLYGGKGDDTIQGGEGSDTIFGQDGNDFLFGDSGTNLVFGGGGNALYGGKGDDHLYGGSDSDVLDGGPGHDVFDCGEGVDRIVGFDPKEDTASSNCEILG